MVKKTENHMKAPKSASFVANMRQVFGNDQVKVLYVREGDVLLGEPSDRDPRLAAVAVDGLEAA